MTMPVMTMPVPIMTVMTIPEIAVAAVIAVAEGDVKFDTGIGVGGADGGRTCGDG